MNKYELRGNRVAPMLKEEIIAMAVNFCHEFGINKRKKKRCDKIFENIEYQSDFVISLSVIPDKEWGENNPIRGHFDPTTFTITVPESTYKLACNGDRDSLFIIFHEYGHLFLGHKAVLHNSKIPPVKQEDAEWQADTFAEFILQKLGFYDSAQIELDFDGM